MTDAQRKIVEDLGWEITGCDAGPDEEKSWLLRKYSPAGEDFGFYVEDEAFEENVREYAADFDPEEHVQMHLDAKYHGKVEGIPSVRELVDDADAIDKMLQDLASALSGVMPGTVADMPQEKAVVEIFLWDGVTQMVKCADQDINVRVVVHNCDTDYSDKTAYETAIEDPGLKEIEWSVDNFDDTDEESSDD